MGNRVSKVLGVAVCALLLAGIGMSTQAFAEAKGPMQFVAEAKAKITEVTPQAVKADFEQSTDLDKTMESAELHKGVLNFRPSRSEAGEVGHFILGMMDGRNTIEQIASHVQAKFPLRFKTQREAQFYVNDISQDFCASEIHSTNHAP